MPKKIRLDKLLLAQELVESRNRAQALILAGQVTVDGRVIDKAGQQVAQDADIQLKARPAYVGRGGIKLAGAIKEFAVMVTDKIALDVGASTGGFTDCLLQHGTKKVYAVDVGYGQLAWKLRQDSRVIILDKCNARYLKPGDIAKPVSLVTIDVSFISITKILPSLIPLLTPDAEIIALVKPQFEVGKGKVGSGGIVRNTEKHAGVLNDIALFVSNLGLNVAGICRSPVFGAKGNTEFFIYLTRDKFPAIFNISELIQKITNNMSST